MRMTSLATALLLAALSTAAANAQGKDVPVPTTCTPQVNAKLQTMIQSHPKGYTENVMVCGIATKTTVNSGGAHGSHHIISLTAQLPNLGPTSIQIAINDTLDGAVSASAGAKVFAYGQGYTTGGAWKAGIHDVHCSTHPTADNGWVVVNSTKTPTSCTTRSHRY